MSLKMSRTYKNHRYKYTEQEMIVLCNIIFNTKLSSVLRIDTLSLCKINQNFQIYITIGETLLIFKLII